MSPFARRALYALLALAAAAVAVFLAWQALQAVAMLVRQYLLLLALAVMGPEAFTGAPQ